jgi:hypothetical protein
VTQNGRGVSRKEGRGPAAEISAGTTYEIGEEGKRKPGAEWMNAESKQFKRPNGQRPENGEGELERTPQCDIAFRPDEGMFPVGSGSVVVKAASTRGQGRGWSGTKRTDGGAQPTARLHQMIKGYSTIEALAALLRSRVNIRAVSTNGLSRQSPQTSASSKWAARPTSWRVLAADGRNHALVPRRLALLQRGERKPSARYGRESFDGCGEKMKRAIDKVPRGD